mgnify:CR=1 FL=1
MLRFQHHQFLYIYQYNLVMNEAYKKGNRRAGCLICPRAAERNDFMNHHCYQEEAEPFVDIIRNEYKRNGGQAALEDARVELDVRLL